MCGLSNATNKPKTRKIISGVLTIILLLTLLIIDNYLPVGLTRTKAENLLTFFMSACMFGGSDAQTQPPVMQARIYWFACCHQNHDYANLDQFIMPTKF